MLSIRFLPQITVKRTFYVKRFSSISQVNTEPHAKQGYKSVAEFYNGKSVFLTGGTGFAGKVLIENLLYSCTKLDKLYMLIRNKKGENANDRVKKMFEGPLYARLKKSHPNFVNKIVPIIGDFHQPNFGITSKDEKTLIDNVSIVLHLGANIKFNQPLAEVMSSNFENTRYMLDLCQRIKNMQSFVNVSSAFAHPQVKLLKEIIYPSPAKLEDVYKYIKDGSNDQKRLVKLINGRGTNTYIFCKALTESYIADNCGDVPTVIVRPSSTKKDDPLKSWMDNRQILSIMIDGITTGFNRIVYGKPTNTIDLIPVDYVANAIIVAATRAKIKELQVFNSTTTPENRVSWEQVIGVFTEQAVKHNRNIWPYPGVIYTESELFLKIFTKIFQTTPAQLADLWLKLRGKTPKYLKMMNLAIAGREISKPYTYNIYDMDATNTRALFKSLSPEDKQSFPFDPMDINWRPYLEDYWKGNDKFISSKYV